MLSCTEVLFDNYCMVSTLHHSQFICRKYAHTAPRLLIIVSLGQGEGRREGNKLS